MRRSAFIAALVVLAPILAPRLSGIGYEEPALGAQAWTYVRQPPLRVPDLMAGLTEEDFAQGGDELTRAATALAAESPGPDSLSELLTALNQARAGFILLEGHYEAAIEKAKANQSEYEAEARNAEKEYDDARQANTNVRSHSLQGATREDYLLGLGVERAKLTEKVVRLEAEKPAAIVAGFHLGELRSARNDLGSAERLIETLQAALNRRSEALAAASAAAQAVLDTEAHLPVISERREVCEDFYEDVCNRVRLMAWKEPMAREYPELRAKAVHPRYTVGNACVFAKHAQEPWLRRCAIEQLGYWQGLYAEARATLESIRDDKSDALAAFAGEQLGVR